jgi:hypothetical protein
VKLLAIFGYQLNLPTEGKSDIEGMVLNEFFNINRSGFHFIVRGETSFPFPSGYLVGRNIKSIF